MEAHPEVVELLAALSPNYERLRDPEARERLAGVATLARIAAIGGFNAEDLAQMVRAVVEGKDPRLEVLRSIILGLHRGGSVEEARERFAKLVREVTPQEISQLEQSLIEEGLPEEEVKRLCDVHVEVFKESLEKGEAPGAPPGHPLHTLMLENRALEGLLDKLEGLVDRSGGSLGGVEAEVGALLDELGEVEKHYLKKENQLFPTLETHGVAGPTQVMWAIHDDVRQALKVARRQWEKGDSQVLRTLEEVGATMRDMVFKEENILFPMSLETLSEEDWGKVWRGFKEVGYAWVEPGEGWSPPESGVEVADVGSLDLDVGSLTPEQVNLVLTHLPVDITFVDENGRVAYYSGGKERIFPRSPGVIGREVSRCHPPKSVHIVERVVRELREGVRDVAEFWIRVGGRLIFIRYFAVRDGAGRFRGVLEVSQDVTDIQGLRGEKRLLDEEPQG